MFAEADAEAEAGALASPGESGRADQGGVGSWRAAVLVCPASHAAWWGSVAPEVRPPAATAAID
ncbi:hypothetical protein GCM10023336_68470 [Streptomyces similanensis]|uniref:Uncharacterized protein n=1 Tax=Streptomyces similanensis TaxID=1274988 RepID=A0ABP9LJW6_9ACTN